MRLPMHVEREKIRLALQDAIIRACALEDDANIIHNEIVGNAIEISVRLPKEGQPFAELCQKLSVVNFMIFHDAILKCLILSECLESLGRKEEGENLRKFLVDRDYRIAFGMLAELEEKLCEEERRKFLTRRKAEGLYLRPELRAEIYIVLNDKRKYIFNMESYLASRLALVKPLTFPRTCAAVKSIEDVNRLILINLAQIRPDLLELLDEPGVAILDRQKFKGWRG